QNVVTLSIFTHVPMKVGFNGERQFLSPKAGY
ncbi:mce related family protein, partial [Vibrio parahaemolyticus V-223/04]